jgi:hypothetical protein
MVKKDATRFVMTLAAENNSEEVRTKSSLEEVIT